MNEYKYMEVLVNELPNVFRNEIRLKNHLRFLYKNPEVEWFNVLSILLCLPEATDVCSLDMFKKRYNQEVGIKDTADSELPILVPAYQNGIFWTIKSVYDVSQLKSVTPSKKESKLKQMVNSISIAELEKEIGEQWIKKLYQHILNMVNICSPNAMIQSFIVECVTSVINEELLGIVKPIDLSLLDSYQGNFIDIIVAIKTILDSLPNDLQTLYDEEKKNRYQKEMINSATRIGNMNIRQLMQEAKRIKVEADKRNDK